VNQCGKVLVCDLNVNNESYRRLLLLQEWDILG